MAEPLLVYSNKYEEYSNEFFNELEKNIKKFDTLNFDRKTRINLFNEYAGLYSSKQKKILKKTIDNVVNHK